MSTEAADALHKILLERGLTIACAESLTVGGVARHLGECSGSSAYFQGGVIAYSAVGYCVDCLAPGILEIGIP